MRNLLYILLAIILFSCSKSKVDYIFDKLPEERMVERNAELKDLLLGAPGGWKAFLRTSLRGSGYGFYMQFDDKGNVTMLSDWNNTYAAEKKTSTYRVQYISNTTLVFDTYNYISILQDPNNANNGGTQKEGLQSDVEFEYIRKSGDTIFLRGRKYQNTLYLLKGTAAESTQYGNGAYPDAINRFNEYFTGHNNNYFSVTSGGAALKVGLTFNVANKTVAAQVKLANNTIVSDTRGYGYSLDGIFFTDAIQIVGYRFFAIKQKDANTMVIIDGEGKEYPILQNPVPLVDMVDLFGYNKAYNSIYCFGKAYPNATPPTLPAGVTSDFNAEFNGLISRFNTSSRPIDTLEFRLSTNNTALVRIWYWSGSSHFLADASFKYTYVDGVITLSDYTPSVSNGNWDSRIIQIGSFLTWLQSGPFKADWVASTAAGSPILGGLYRVNQPSNFFYGLIRKQ